jgi:hypothetical protein
MNLNLIQRKGAKKQRGKGAENQASPSLIDNLLCVFAPLRLCAKAAWAMANTTNIHAKNIDVAAEEF